MVLMCIVIRLVSAENSKLDFNISNRKEEVELPSLAATTLLSYEMSFFALFIDVSKSYSVNNISKSF